MSSPAKALPVGVGWLRDRIALPPANAMGVPLCGYRQIRTHIKQVCELTKAAREALNKPCPDTLLGRKTHDPFPVEDPMERPDIQNLIHGELKLPK
jgi:hypothetical protein